MAQPRRGLSGFQIVGLVLLVIVAIAVVGPWLLNRVTETALDVTGGWKVTIYNPSFDTAIGAELDLTQIQDEIWGSMVTELTEYSVKGRRQGTRFVLELTNTVYPSRKMTLYANFTGINTLAGEYKATTGLGLFGVELSWPTEGRWSACKKPC